MLSIFIIFILEFVAFRWGTAKLARLGIQHDPHGHVVGSHASHGPEGGMSANAAEETEFSKSKESESERGSIQSTPSTLDSAWAQVIGVGILEHGVVLHR